MQSMLLLLLLMSNYQIKAQTIPNCSNPVNISSPTLNIFSILTNCLVNPYSSADPKLGEYYDINTVPLIIRDVTLFASAPWEAAKFYQPHALGRRAYGLDVNRYRRPQSENTPLNINTAASYAMFRLANARFTWNAAIQNQRNVFLNILGLNPDDQSLDWSTPVGIGNQVAKAIINYMYTDGMNQLGELDCNYYNCEADGYSKYEYSESPCESETCRPKAITYHRQFNRMNFSDYTCYKPVNRPEKLCDLNRWQPGFDFYDNVTWIVQKIAMPQWMNVIPYSNINVDKLVETMPGPIKAKHEEAYFEQAKELVDISANLNDTQKMIAEYFNNKSRSLITPTAFLVAQQFAQGKITKLPIAVMKSVALATVLWQDAGIVSWAIKRKFDYIRPFSAIKYLFQDETIRAWAHNQGTKSMKGIEWEPYLRTGPFQEYVSTSTCLAYSLSQGFYHVKGNNSNWGQVVVFPKGSSSVEPGITPKTDIAVTFETLDTMKLLASVSRMWGGVHFRSASEDPRQMCTKIGDEVFNQWVREMNGDPVLDGV